jgi:hypothetical protein
MLVDAQAERRGQVGNGTERTRLGGYLSVLVENPRHFLDTQFRRHGIRACAPPGGYGKCSWEKRSPGLGKRPQQLCKGVTVH